MISQLKKFCNRELQEEEGIALEWWVKGRALADIADTEGFQVILEILEAYAESDEKAVMNLPLGDPRVVAAHAAARTSRANHSRLREDVAAAVQAAKDTPEVVKEAYRGMPPESI